MLYMNEEIKTVFYPEAMDSFRCARKVIDLVRAKVYPIGRAVGSFKCNKSRFQVCLKINETEQ